MKIKKMPGGDFLVHIDADLRSLAERKMFVAIGEDGAPQHPEMVPILVKLGRANKMLEMLASGTYADRKDMSDCLGMDRRTVARTVNAAFLSPVIVERIVSGQLPPQRVQPIIDKMNTMLLWADQHRALGIE